MQFAGDSITTNEHLLSDYSVPATILNVLSYVAFQVSALIYLILL